MATGRTSGEDDGTQAMTNSPSLVANDLVKCTQDGQTDWTTLANIITANLLGEVLCASYADYKYGRRSKDFKPDIEWKFSYEENNVLVFTKKHVSDKNVICFVGRSEIDLPVSTVAVFLQKLENFCLWNKFMTESRLVQLLSESDSHRDMIGYFVHETKRCLIRTKRDMLLFIHSRYTNDKFIQTGISIDHPSCPLKKNITRAKCCLGSGWVVEAYEGQKSKSLVSLVCNIDTKGNLPPVLVSRFLQRQPMAIHYMRRCVMEEAQKLKPYHQVRFSFGSNGIVSDNKRTVTNEVKDSKEKDLSLSSSEFAGNTVGSYIFLNSSSKQQYEEPMGISEFIGHHTLPKQKKKKWKHRCCYGAMDHETAGNEVLINSGSSSCEECAICRDRKEN